jgi:hypothetical protein
MFSKHHILSCIVDILIECIVIFCNDRAQLCHNNDPLHLNCFFSFFFTRKKQFQHLNWLWLNLFYIFNF